MTPKPTTSLEMINNNNNNTSSSSKNEENGSTQQQQQQSPKLNSSTDSSSGDEELKQIYKTKKLEFHALAQSKKYDRSLLVLEKKGLVKEISAKFQTPDTASFTKINPHTHQSIVERIAYLKKENERKKADFEMTRRERVIQLDDIELSSTQDELRERLYGRKKDDVITVSSILNSSSSTSSPNNTTSSTTPWKKNDSGDSNAAAAVVSTTISTTTSSTSTTSSSKASSKIIGRRRRDDKSLPSFKEANTFNLQNYLSVSPVAVVAKPTLPPLAISSDCKQYLKNIILSNTGKEIVSIEHFSSSTPDRSNNQSSSSSSSNSSFLSSSPPVGSSSSSSMMMMNTTTALRMKALQASFQIQFILPNQSSVSLPCKGNETVESVKEKLMQVLESQRIQLSKQQQQQSQQSQQSLSPDTKDNNNNNNGTVKIKKFESDSYLIMDIENRPLEKSLSLNKCEYILEKRARSLIPKLKLVEKSNYYDAHPKEELSGADYEIITKILPKSTSWKGEEVDSFRRVAARLRYDLLGDIKGAVCHSLSVRLSPLPLPFVPGKILISVFLPILQVTKTLELESGETADLFLERLFFKNYSKHLPNVTSSDFILKVMGCSDYVHGPHDLKTFEYIRKCILQGTKTQLVLIQRPKIELDVPPFKQRFNFAPELPINFEVGQYSSKSLHWEDLTHILIRDIKKPLKIKVLGAYNIPTSYLNKDDDNISVIVSMSLYHGLECLGQTSTGIEPIIPPSFFNNNNVSLNSSSSSSPPTLLHTNSSLSLKDLDTNNNNQNNNNTNNNNVQSNSSLSSSTSSTNISTLNVQWNEQVIFTNMDYSNLPKETRLCISLYATKSSSSSTTSSSSSSSSSSSTNNNNEMEPDLKKDFPIGWVNLTLCDYNYQLRNGILELKLWPDDVANPIATCVANSQSSTAVSLFIEFEQFALPVIFPSINHHVPNVEPPTINSKDMRDFFEYVIKLDPLSEMAHEKYQQLWALRHYAMLFPQVLPRLMLSVPWNNPACVDEIHSFIDRWPRLKAYDALELLDAKHADRNVREYAVSCLDDLPEEELLDILLQLIQILKVEPYHDNMLARFLLRKAILNRSIGHSFFWYLKSDLHVEGVAERFGLYLESYLHSCGTHRQELLRQIQVIDGLTEVAKKIKPLKDQDRREVMIRELEAFDWPKRFQITLNPRFESNGLITSKCKYMDSKKLPLKLSFTNIDMGAEPIEIIFKVGDDLRQDMLTLQMIRLMDKLWQKEGLDLKLSPYGCIATGDMIGMIEVVLNSETTARIQKTAGGATAAFKLDPLANWLHEHNKTDAEYQKAVDTFILSCAGYCVATYVLGIGDRHNDNLMCTKLGRLFHIDFGHFLGNYKKKFGFKRERAPFVFTPDFCYVMGGKESPKFVQFVNYCCTAYNILRRHAKLFMNLFAMMVSTGIPELQSMDDLNYLQESFSLELSDEKAREKFIGLIHESLTTKTTQVNNYVHLLVH
ncbi:phosphatidylinositol-4,5-diphosphate 3-kinase [Cavenderia fasciculata]|uniref:phosphatidylinositol 3-kinase n=1 Tax=Cavenderia fasciculata TaxID=261658 RepID=F4QEL1_CACFS|nr:phosphatidylinositol-4,5-diphosphate 3-kinase [Cavenderia fasciculata]EGG14122.1 phosphatidylinositol-4,5-diphosphate 3-kinase [Cavenderia fasciculata]|eukprot:XP_004350830.1 phosphatidylinositol-4,5-diphosphate 3-kinase [Cavenderia fasciculata]